MSIFFQLQGLPVGAFSLTAHKGLPVGAFFLTVGLPVGAPRKMLLRANLMLKKMLLRANPPEEVAPTGKPHSIGFARRSNAVTYKRQRKYLDRHNFAWCWKNFWAMNFFPEGSYLLQGLF